MIAKVFKPLVILCVLTAFCFLGYTISTSADGRGERCKGNVWSDWETSCSGHSKTYCSSKNGTLVAKSTKECVKGNSSDYCEISQTQVAEGQGSCSWNQKDKTCENPSINGSVPKDNC